MVYEAEYSSIHIHRNRLPTTERNERKEKEVPIPTKKSSPPNPLPRIVCDLGVLACRQCQPFAEGFHIVSTPIYYIFMRNTRKSTDKKKQHIFHSDQKYPTKTSTIYDHGYSNEIVFFLFHLLCAANLWKWVIGHILLGPNINRRSKCTEINSTCTP